MLYTEFIHKAIDLTVEQGENGMWYLQPEWQDMISRQITYDLESLTDSYLSGWYDVEDILKLEVEKRNALADRTPFVMEWMYELLSATVEPKMLQEETEYIKNLMSYMKFKEENGDVQADAQLRTDQE